jgi:hypothetical protein
MSQERDAQKRAAQAQHILDSAVFRESFDAVRERLVQDMATMGTDSDVKNARAILSLQMLDRVRKILVHQIQTGKLLELDEERKKRFRLF